MHRLLILCQFTLLSAVGMGEVATTGQITLDFGNYWFLNCMTARTVEFVGASLGGTWDGFPVLRLACVWSFVCRSMVFERMSMSLMPGSSYEHS